VKPLKQQVKGAGAALAEAEPAYGMRLHPVLFSLLFAAFAGYICYQWWTHFPIQPRVFREYWSRDSKFLIPNFPGFVQMWWPSLLSVLLLACFEVVSWRAGARLLAWVFPAPPSGLWGFLLGLGLGNGMLGTATLGFGLSGLIKPSIFWTILAVPLVIEIWIYTRYLKNTYGVKFDQYFSEFVAWFVLLLRFRRFMHPFNDDAAESFKILFWFFMFAYLVFIAWRTIKAFNLIRTHILPENRLLKLSLFEKVMAGFSVFIVMYNFVPVLEPEWFYDSLVYHLAVPSRWLVHGRICSLPDTFFSNFPFLQEMQYMFFLVLGNDIAARILHWTEGIICAVTAYAIAAPLMGRTTGIVAAAVFCSLPQLRFLQHVTMVELGLGWLAVLATMCFMRATGLMPVKAGETSSRRAWLFLAAWYLGFGQGTKYLGLFISAILAGWLLLELTKGRGTWKRLAGDLALITAWGSVWTAPWLAKNFLFTGNPVFPMLGGLLPALNWDRQLYERWMFDNTKYGTGRGSIIAWIRMPMEASVETAHFGTFTLNPFFLVFLPVLLVLKRIPAPVVFLGAYSAVYSLVWALTSQQTRFLMPMAPQAAVAVAFLLMKAWEGRRLVGGVVWAAGAWIFLVSAYGEFQNRFTNNAMVPYMNGHISKADILDMGVQYYRTIQAANRLVPPGRRLIFLGGDENYYFTKPMICSSIYDRCAIGELAKLARDPEDLRRLFMRRRISHLLVHEPRCDEYSTGGMFEWGEKPRKIFLDYWHTYGRIVYQSKGVFLFDLTGPPIPAGSRKQGVPLCFYPSSTVTKAKLLMARADAFFQAERFDDAQEATAELITTIPAVAHAWSYRAYAVGALKKNNESIRCYEKSIRLGYPTVAAFYNLGYLYEKTSRYGEALGIYMQGLDVERDYVALKERAAELSYTFRQFGPALVLFEEIAATGHASPTSLDRLKELRAMQGRR